MTNLYDILKIKPTSTKQEIKKAYRELVLIYHPDKNHSPNAQDQFKEIHAAYEILIDEHKRKEYDGLSSDERDKLYDVLRQYFTEIRPQYSSLYNSMVNYLYKDDEDNLKTDLNNFNIKNIFSRFVGKLYEDSLKENIHQGNINIQSKSVNLGDDKNIDHGNIDHVIYTTLLDKYKNKCEEITICRPNSQSYDSYIIPVCETELILKNAGDLIKNSNIYGNINIKIICTDDQKYDIKQINNHDLLIIKKISLYQYIYGDTIMIEHLDGEQINFTFETCLEKKPIFTITKKGLPKYDKQLLGDAIKNKTFHKDNNVVNDNDCGDLIIYLTINGINSPDNDPLSIEYSQTVKDTIKMLFH